MKLDNDYPNKIINMLRNQEFKYKRKRKTHFFRLGKLKIEFNIVFCTIILPEYKIQFNVFDHKEIFYRLFEILKDFKFTKTYKEIRKEISKMSNIQYQEIERIANKYPYLFKTEFLNVVLQKQNEDLSNDPYFDYCPDGHLLIKEHNKAIDKEIHKRFVEENLDYIY